MTVCVAVGLVERESGRVLLQLRDAKDGIAYPAHWALLAGRVRSGEDPADAVRRELAEELRPPGAAAGLEPQLLADLEGPFGAERLYLAELPAGDWQIAEGAGSATFSLRALPEPIPPHHLEMLALLRGHLEQR